MLELQTDAGELKIVPEPEGTRGYDDLRHRARREPIGRGLRPSVASPDDHARMLAALGREQDQVPLQTMQRLIELERELHRGRGLVHRTLTTAAARRRVQQLLTAITGETQMHPGAKTSHSLCTLYGCPTAV